MVSLAKPFMPVIIPANMENENWIKWTFDQVRLKLQEGYDERYTQRNGQQKLINVAVIGFIALLCTTVLGGIFGLFTGLIHFP